MARTAKAAAQVVRREAFVDTALRLVQEKGYEQMSVQDVLDALDASKGAFYHYFDSKRSLLLAVVERMSDQVFAALAPLLDDPRRTALEKLEGLFGGIAAWKAERRELVIGTLEAWISDDNAIVREKVRRSTTRRLVPVLAAIVAQGMAEGLFTVTSPDGTARVVMALILGFQEEALDLYLARRAGTIPFEEVVRRYRSSLEALDRVLGLPAGTFRGLDEASLRLWFG